jgi:4-phospho-D-threonate 3-dehydrogenase / 4-phospho-D-erythronate 3-dehydrogenase
MAPGGRIAITLGDVTGIGPEVTLKALAGESSGDDVFVLIGDSGHIRRLNESLGLNLPLGSYTGAAHAPGRVLLLDPSEKPLPAVLSPGAAQAATAAFQWLHEGARRCLSGEFQAMVTAPVNKEAIVNAGHSFVGQTELLSGLANAQRTAMMLLGHDDRGRWLRVALATTHVPIRKLADAVTFDKVLLAIELAAQSCADLGLPRRRVAVCGLNPHAGEGGKIGTEDGSIIQPAADAARRNGLDVVGPMSADALFYYAYRGDYDAVVAMYHDQGLAPLKMVAFEHGINWTLGLTFIRTSPDHGTAYDIAGKGLANPSSMIAAINLARTLAQKKRAQS